MPLPRRFNATAIAVVASLAFTPVPLAIAQSAAPAGCIGPASSTWITITAEGLRNGNGSLAVTLYEDNSRKFLAKGGAFYVGWVEANSGTTRACVFLPQQGVYAIALYHDENANHKFDRTGIGFPAEGYGFSNNPATLAGLPSFRSVRLNVPRTGLSTRIRMKYP